MDSRLASLALLEFGVTGCKREWVADSDNKKTVKKFNAIYLKPGVNQLLPSPFGGGFFMRIDDPSWRPSAGGAELSAIEFLAGTLAATERPINGCNPGVHFEFRRCAALRRWLLLLAGMEAPQIHQGSERIGAFFELLQRDPFIVRVRLANISGAKNRDIVEFRQARAVCSVGHRD